MDASETGGGFSVVACRPLVAAGRPASSRRGRGRRKQSFSNDQKAGAKLLIAEPWRAARIVRGAGAMMLSELAAEAARRRTMPPPVDFNRALALAQLARALEAPSFAEAFAAWRSACAKPARSPR
jgi:hypothetical protein